MANLGLNIPGTIPWLSSRCEGRYSLQCAAQRCGAAHRWHLGHRVPLSRRHNNTHPWDNSTFPSAGAKKHTASAWQRCVADGWDCTFSLVRATLVSVSCPDDITLLLKLPLHPRRLRPAKGDSRLKEIPSPPPKPGSSTKAAAPTQPGVRSHSCAQTSPLLQPPRPSAHSLLVQTSVRGGAGP